MKKGKYLQIFRYLYEFSKIRSNPVRNIDAAEAQYPEKVWFDEIPENPLFDCVTFPDFNEDSEYWINIRKPVGEPTEPEFPKLSRALNDWVDAASLTDENGIPTLRPSIEKNGQLLEIIDHPQVEAELKIYIDNRWLDDLLDYKGKYSEYEDKLAEFEKLNSIYKRFFGIFTKAEQYGEEFELVVGVGLLNYKQDDRCPHILRHILTSKVEISFEYTEKESYIRVYPSIDSQIIIEDDSIIDLVGQFQSSDIVEAEKSVSTFLAEKEISNDLFDVDIKDALGLFAGRFHSDGDFFDESTRPRSISKKPIITFSPALLLRKRNTQSFTALYEKIIADLEKADDSLNITSLNDLIGVFDQKDDGSDGQGSDSQIDLEDQTIYFPKKFNDEQIAIVQKSRKNDKILVQGPPGTGKSHTIANLICHLLANGKKVLVTAHTPQALDVLKKQLPEETQNLAVNLMGGDAASIQDMEASVNAINEEIANWNIGDSMSRIHYLEEKLSELNENIAGTKHEWLKVKEKSTRKQIVNDAYQGTLLQIAERLERDAGDFQWFNDSYSSTDNFDIIHDIENYVTRLKTYESIDCSSFYLSVPDNDDLPSIEDLQEYLRIIGEVEQRRQFATASMLIESVDLNNLKSDLKALLELYVKIEQNKLPLKSKLISEYVLSVSEWTKRLRETESLLTELSGKMLRELDQNVEIAYPSDKSLIQLKNDARQLLDFLNEGNRLEGLLFKVRKGVLPKEIKEKLYFIEGVRVNGSDCDTISEFEAVINDLEIKQVFQQLNNQWGLKPENELSNYVDAERFYFELSEETTSLIRSIDESIGLKAKIESNSNVRIHSTESVRIEQLIESVNFNSLLKKESSFKARLVAAKQFLNLPNSHPIAQTLLDDLVQLNASSYGVHLTALGNLRRRQQEYHEFKAFETDLRVHFPILIRDIQNGVVNSEEIKQLRGAVYFRHAQNAVSQMLGAHYENELIGRLNDLEHEKEQTVGSLAARKAWLVVFQNLESNRSLRQNLIAWVKAVSKIGKTGKGKRALKFRRIAQAHMEECKDSIPCWIMPLFKVAETIDPKVGMYDYVIIDEASQLGPDAIFLLYISKNVIIVGDDKQTSPEYVGVDANTMAPYIQQHLQGIPFSNHYDINFSFFDHAELFCPDLIVLREHFRCMPEIIEFSNKYFYAPQGKGLYPLKQYSEHRLEPLKTVFCPTGNTIGQNQYIYNRVEAESLVNKVAELVADKRYEGKTFGIIVLQGTAQVKLINDMLLEKIDEREYKSRKIRCGISSKFQGEERDIIFLSLVTAHNHVRSALTRPEDERRFNVAMSRAKEQAWVFHSVQLEDLQSRTQGVIDLRFKLLDHFLNYKENQTVYFDRIERRLGNQPEPFDSWFEVDVFNDIVSRGHKVIPQYEVARGKYRIDLVSVLPNGTKIAIECDGDQFHGADQYENDLMRQRILERCGWQFFRVSGGEYYSDRRRALEPLWKLLVTNDYDGIDTASVLGSSMVIAETSHESEFPEFVASSEESEHEILFDFEDLEIESAIEGISGYDTRNIKTSEVESYDTVSEFLVFTSKQNVYKVRNQGFSNTSQVLNLVETEPGERIIYVTGTKDYSEFLLVAFENGKIGKISVDSYRTDWNRKKLINAFNDESPLIFIELFDHDLDLVAVSNINKVLVFNTSQINRVSSKVTKGVNVLKSRDASYMYEVRKTSDVTFASLEYYRKNIPAMGNFLLPQDSLQK